MAKEKENIRGTVAIIGNNPSLQDLISSSFYEANLVTLTQFELVSRKADYCIFIHNESAPHSSGQLNQLLEFLNSDINSDSKFALIFQHTNLSPESSPNPYLQVISEARQNKPINIRTIHLYDLYSQSKSAVSVLDEKIKKSLLDGQITISADGQTKLFPLAFIDFFEGLSRSLFIQKTNDQIYYFGGPAVYDIDLAYSLKSIYKKFDIELDINQTGSKLTSVDIQSLIDNTSSRLNWIPETEIENYLSAFIPQIIDKEKSTEKPIIITNKKTPLSPIKLLKFAYPHDGTIKALNLTTLFKIFSYLIITTSLVYIFILTAFTASLYATAKYTSSSFTSLQNGDIKNTKANLSRSRLAHTISSSSFSLISPSIALLSSRNLELIDNSLLFISHANSSLERLSEVYVLGQSFFQDSLSGNQSDTKAVSSSISSQLEALRTELNQITLLNSALTSKKLFSIVPINLPDNYNPESISRLKSQVTSAITLIRLLPTIFTENKTSKYLVIIQDSNEYRPTGGYINTYALFNFQGNRLVDSKVDSAININQLLSGTVTPPEKYTLLTGTTNWSFSDSNFNPNFPDSASQIAWFYQKNTGIIPDGVIALNLSFFENFLKYSGPIKLSSGTEITSANIRLLISNPTQETPTDLLTQITTKIITDIKTNQYNFSTISRSLFENITNSEVNLWLSDTTQQKIVDSTILAGIIKASPCPPQFHINSCLSETYSINEANYSINKSNAYQNREISHTVNISPIGEITHQIQINYSYPNMVPNTTNSAYKSLLRIIVPTGTTVSSITFDQAPFPLDQITVSQIYNLQEISLPIVYSLNSEHNLIISLTSPYLFDLLTSPSSYSLTTIKQPGVINSKLSLTINYPPAIKPTTLSLPGDIASQSISFSSTPISNSTYAVIFSNTSSR